TMGTVIRGTPCAAFARVSERRPTVKRARSSRRAGSRSQHPAAPPRRRVDTRVSCCRILDVVRMLFVCDHTKRHILIGPLFDTARRRHAYAVGVDQVSDYSARCIVERFFRELKSRYHAEGMPSSKRGLSKL